MSLQDSPPDCDMKIYLRAPDVLRHAARTNTMQQSRRVGTWESTKQAEWTGLFTLKIPKSPQRG